MQLIAARYILPWFGGSASVWTTSLVFFQVLLLAGYLYAHLLTDRLPLAAQVRLHQALLGFTGALVIVLSFTWPSAITPGLEWRPASVENPALGVIALLTAAVGLPFFLMASTGPLLQKWLSLRREGEAVYRSYSVSNLGSLLGLLSFPFAVEPGLGMKDESRLWVVLFLLLLAGLAWCAQFAGSGAKNTVERTANANSPGKESVFWFALAGCATALLLAATNLLCQEVTSMPLLWVLPLALYLVTLILCFDHPRWYKRAIVCPAYAAVLLLTALSLQFHNYRNQLFLLPVALFLTCMVCHGELARRKPDPSRLTSFYLWVAAGGAAGGMFVAIAAPLIFSFFTELQVSLGLSAVLLLIALVWDGKVPKAGIAAGAIFAAATIVMLYLGTKPPDPVFLAVRNFYGALRVSRGPDGTVKLEHGQTTHGYQLPAPQDQLPTLYYGPNSTIGVVLRNYPRKDGAPLRVGAVGLGAGTLATYGLPGDIFRFYEINPAIVALSLGAQPTFTYVNKSPAKIEIATGDARLLLEREPPQDFDVLVLDAFNGDAIPVHLLTREAFEIYLKHLKQNGIIAVHLSSRHVNLEPVLHAVVEEFPLEGRATFTIEKPPFKNSLWMLFSRRHEMLELPGLDQLGQSAPGEEAPVYWTDDRTSLWPLLRP